MTGFGNVLKDAGQIPIAEVYPPGASGNFAALQGSTNTTTDAAGNVSSPANFNLSQIGSVVAQMAGSDGVTSANVLEVASGLFNGATTDQQRGNLDNITLINASAVTTTQTSADQKNYNARMLYVVVNVTTLTGTSPTLTPKLQGKGPVSVQYFAIGAALTAISATGLYVYLFSLSAPAAAGGVTATSAFPIPRTWNWTMTAGGTITNATYTVEAMYIL